MGDPEIEMAGRFPSNQNTCSVMDSQRLGWTRSVIAVAVNSMVSSVYVIPRWNGSCIYLAVRTYLNTGPSVDSVCRASRHKVMVKKANDISSNSVLSLVRQSPKSVSE